MPEEQDTIRSGAGMHNGYTSARLPALMAAAITGAFFLTFALVAVPRFETNDDGLMMILSANLCGLTADQSFCPRTANIIVGSALQLAYRMLPRGMDWYAFYLYAFHAISVWLLTYVLIRKHGLGVNLLVFLAMLAVFEWRSLQYLQFTTTACITGLAGAAYVVLSDWEARRDAPWLVLAVVLLATSGVIRREAFYLTAVLFAPLVLTVTLERKSARWLIPLGTATLLFLGAVLCEQSLLDEHGREYHEFLAGLQRIVENPRVVAVRQSLSGQSCSVLTPEAVRAYAEVGWSPNDVALFHGRFFFDPSVYNTEVLNRIASHFGWASPVHPAVEFLARLKGSSVFGCCLAITLAISAVLLAPGKGFQCALATGTVLGVGLGLCYSIKLPFRVLIPLCFFLCFLCVFWIEVRAVGMEYGRVALRLSARAVRVGLLCVYGGLAAVALRQHAQSDNRIDEPTGIVAWRSFRLTAGLSPNIHLPFWRQLSARALVSANTRPVLWGRQRRPERCWSHSSVMRRADFRVGQPGATFQRGQRQASRPPLPRRTEAETPR